MVPDTLKKIVDCITSRYLTSGLPSRQEEIAKELGISETTVYRYLRNVCQRRTFTPIDYIDRKMASVDQYAHWVYFPHREWMRSQIVTLRQVIAEMRRTTYEEA